MSNSLQSNTQILDNQDMSVSWLTSEFSLRRVIWYSVSVNIFSGAAPTGTLSLEFSNDNDPAFPGSNTAVWQTVPGSSQAISDVGLIVWNVRDVGYRWLRVRYVAVSGTGSVDVMINIKGF